MTYSNLLPARKCNLLVMKLLQLGPHSRAEGGNGQERLRRALLWRHWSLPDGLKCLGRRAQVVACVHLREVAHTVPLL
jgi:hypothetical protein